MHLKIAPYDSTLNARSVCFEDSAAAGVGGAWLSLWKNENDTGSV